MTAKKAHQEKVAILKKAVKVSKDMQKLIDTLKLSAEIVLKIAQSEKRLMLLKANKESAKCKVERQRARNLKFYRHEHTTETIALLQRIANSIQ